jgi:hypothetical protein
LLAEGLDSKEALEAMVKLFAEDFGMQREKEAGGRR